MSLVVLCFPCCVDEQPPPRRRPKIDRTMIGEPMGFKHTGHIGSGELATGFDIHNVQDQMQSKGGYEYSCNVSEPEGLDLRLTEGNPGDKQSDQSQQNNSPEVKQQGDQNQETQGDQTHQTEAVSQNDQNSSQDESNRTAEPNQL